MLAVLGLTLCLGCSKRTRLPSSDTPDLRLAVITDLKGYLEPCGCTSDPLGGIDRMAAQIEALRKDGVPLLFLVAGDAFFDAAEIEPARVDQEQRNAKTLVEILNLLKVDALLAGERDRAQPKATLTELRARSKFPWLAMKGDAEVLPIEEAGLRIGVVGVRPKTERDAVMAAVGTASGRSDLLVVLIDGSRQDANQIGRIDGVDFLIHGGLDQDEPVPPRRAGDAWVLHASRQGQGLTVVDVFQAKSDAAFIDRSEWSRREQTARLQREIAELSAKIEAWEASEEFEPAELEPQRQRLADLKNRLRSLDAPTIERGDNAFAARFVQLHKTAPRDARVRKQMREHDKAVNEANRVAFANLKPPPLGPDDIAYVGSAACGGCHQQAYSWWRNHAHGVAYLTLQQRHKEYNLDCVSCHVTGYGEPGGSTVTHTLDGALRNVGCESCHGPGAAHVSDPEKAPMVRVTPESTCIECHNEEHSDLFEYEEYMKTLVVPGHGLPTKSHGVQ